ncbi:stress response protein [Aeromicrobium chenweiae]|uniref:Stress response protein n=1 Tax=Aeromicrobium chenweiae TaxID=2079793 RepID=A0A2S0WKW5_9ACTN|nr:stress response protein [Aeromicrobium chenweiae]AWB91914.1 stress response protein [Aeromicrobium chenweiae]TGN32763.1 stress response protein [Aeromicrobium chenweiae]
MSEETWHQARLIPTSGISGAPEQERRATSALLAVLSIVPDYSKALLSAVGASAGKVSTYIEVPFDLDGQRVYPDGLIRVKRGAKEWTALVEVKTGKNVLEAQQLENYLDVARAENFDALITISNEIPPVPGQHPTAVDKRKLRKVAIHHWSWSYVLATAIVQKEHRGVDDPEQAWILGELIRYLEHERSGALDLDDMGPNWVAVREAVAAGTLRANDKTAPEIVSRFDALLRYASLRLGQQLGTDVTPLLTRQEVANPATRASALLASLVQTGELTGVIRIPNTVAPINVVADLRANRITCYVDVNAPQEGRQTTRVNWIVRQLKDARPDVRVESFAARARGAGAAELLADVREDPKLLVTDPNRDIRSFRIALSVPGGSKRGRGRGAFIDSVLDTLDTFYGEVVQHIKPWAAAPPKLREADRTADVSNELVSTDLSSQDGPEDAD